MKRAVFYFETGNLPAGTDYVSEDLTPANAGGIVFNDPVTIHRLTAHGFYLKQGGNPEVLGCSQCLVAFELSDINGEKIVNFVQNVQNPNAGNVFSSISQASDNVDQGQYFVNGESIVMQTGVKKMLFTRLAMRSGYGITPVINYVGRILVTVHYDFDEKLKS